MSNQNHPNRSSANQSGLTVNAVAMYLQPQAFDPDRHGVKWVLTIRDGEECLRSDFGAYYLTPTAEDKRRWANKVVEVVRRNPDLPVRIGYKSRMQFRDGGTAPLREVVGAICDLEICRAAGVLKLATLDGYPVHMRDWDSRNQRPTLGATLQVSVPAEMIWPKFSSPAAVYG